MRSGCKATSEPGYLRLFALWVAVLTISVFGLWTHSQTGKGPLRSRVYKLRHIDSTTAKNLLVRLKIGVDYNTLSRDVLLVTSDQSLDLVKATSVMTVADREVPVDIRSLMVLGESDLRPKTEDLAVRLRTLTVGTLDDGPPIGVANPVVVDVFEGALIGIGTPEALEMIESAIAAWKAEKAPRKEDASVPAASEVPAEIPDVQPASQPSLSDVAAQILTDVMEKPAVEPEPEPDLPVEIFPEQILIDAAAAQDAAALEQAATDEDTDTAVKETEREPRRLTEADAQPDVSDVEDSALRAALEKLLAAAKEPEQGIEQEQPVTALETEPEESQQPDTAPVRIAAGPVLPPDKAEEELELTITLPEEVEIEALLELVGKQLGLNYMYDRAIFAGAPGKVMLKVHDGKIKVGDLYALLESVLRFRGFVMTRRGSLVTIVRQQDLASVDPVLRRPDEAIQPGDVMVSSVFELKHISPVSAQNLLGQMRFGTQFNAIVETGTLIVTDYAYRMEQIRQIISMIDVVGPPKEFQFRQLRYMQAADLAPKVKALASQIQGVSITVGDAAAGTLVQPATPAAPQTAAQRAQQLAQQRAQRAAQQQQQLAQQAPESAQEMVYLEADERTNRVLMIGYADELKIVNQLIDSLDVAGFDLRIVREYVIQYVEATEVITVLNDLGLARVTVGFGGQTQQQQTRQPRPGQPLTPQQQQLQQQQQQQQQQPGMRSPMTASGDISEPYISLRPATNSLLVNATEEQHKAIELVISHVDVLQKDQRTIQEYEIQYVDTQSVLDTLADLGIITPRQPAAQGAAAAATARAGTPQQRQQAQQMAGMGPEGGPGALLLPMADGTEREITTAEPQIAVLAATNSLLVHATPRQHASIAMVIAHADRQLDRMFAPYVVYALENQSPDELADILNTLIKETLEDAAARTQPSAPDARIQTRPTQTVATLPSGEEQRIRIVPDPKTYSLVVYANKRNQQWIGELIRELDEYRPQVLLDVALVEVTQNERFRYDLDLITKTYGGTTLQPGSPISSLTNFSSQDLFDARSRSGQGLAFFNSEKIQAFLDVVEDKGYGRIMAKPKLLVNDSQEGEIRSENTVAVPQVKTHVIPGTGVSNPTTSTDVVFSDYVAGVILKIRPIISKGDMLRLEIEMNRTDFTERTPVTVSTSDGDLTVPVPPDRLSTDVLTTATIPDGTTIILGGLETINQRKTHTKVPILGDLPLLGGLFRGIDNTGSQSRLYVFVTASILRPADQIEGLEDMRRVSERNRQSFEKHESRFQEMQSWPGIKDRQMDPDRVLEDY